MKMRDSPAVSFLKKDLSFFVPGTFARISSLCALSDWQQCVLVMPSKKSIDKDKEVTLLRESEFIDETQKWEASIILATKSTHYIN